MTAMGCQRFIVTLIDAKLGKQEERDWDQHTVLQNIGWLKHMNARGYDVWIRPSGEHSLVVLGGLNAVQLQTLKDKDYMPAAVIETGTGQYQVWLKLAHMPVADKLRSQVKQEILKEFDRVGIKVTDRVDGRLAGFTNQQVQHSGGRHPFVLLNSSEGRDAPAAKMALERLDSVRKQSLSPIRVKNGLPLGAER